MGEIRGFVGWIGSFLFMGVYFLWAFLPDNILRQTLGLTFLPDKYWAIAFPILLVSTFSFVVISYFAMNLWNTPHLDDPTTIRDFPHNKSGEIQSRTKITAHSIPAAHDIAPEYVSWVLYGDDKKSKDSIKTSNKNDIVDVSAPSKQSEKGGKKTEEKKENRKKQR